jgi:hypothetical protein
MFNESVIHNIENIHLSQFDDPANLEFLSSDEAHYDVRMNKKNPPEIKELILLGQEENPPRTEGTSETSCDSKLLSHTSKNNSESPESTNDEKKTALQDDLSTKREFHYGMKKYSIPSKFKKFQPPFSKKPNKDNNHEGITEQEQNEIDQLIISLLRKKHNSTNRVLHPDDVKTDKNKNNTSLPQTDYNKEKMEECINNADDKDTTADTNSIKTNLNP